MMVCTCDYSSWSWQWRAQQMQHQLYGLGEASMIYDNHKTICIVNHATSSQRKAAMNHFWLKQARANAVPLTAFSPSIQSLCTIDDTSRKYLGKFEISFVIARVNPLHNV